MNNELLSDEPELHKLRRPKFEEWCKRRSLDLTMDLDAWNRPKYKHSHIDAMWDGYNWACADASAELADATKSIKTLSF